jgi:hypothetical protein
MTLKDLISNIQDELTNSCGLPYKLNYKEAERLVKNAEKWFYANYSEAVIQVIIPIPNDLYQTEDFKRTRSIQMPDCVISVFDLRESSVGMFGPNKGDFADSKVIGSEIFLAPQHGEALLYRTVMYSYFDLAKAYVLETIAHDWNRNTKTISILGRTPTKHTFVKAYVKIPEDKLYDDELFLRYCLAQAKISLGRLLGMFNYTLPGGIQVNFGDIKADGKEELAEIKQQIDGENSPDWFFQWN